MTDYRPPLRDIRFVLDHVADLQAIAGFEGFEHADPEIVKGVLEEASKFMSEVVAPTNAVGDREGLGFDGGEVTTPDVYKDAYRKLCESGWNAIGFPAEFGGGNMPGLLSSVVCEMLIAANSAFAMLPGLTAGAVRMLLAHGSEEQKETYVRRMVSGEWAGTMNLTEPEAGSDVGALRTTATPAGDGTYRVKGTKIFISFGEHDCTENIVHLVLARTPGAPAGTKGISCLIVPKYLVNPDGSLGARNDVRCVSIEEKLGIHSSPTCVLSYGDDEGAVGYLVGEENRGMRYMFTMMNDARLAVAIAGTAIGERAYQQALAFARERVQGRPIGVPAGEAAPIVEHADVRRMLMTMKAQIEAMRALNFATSAALDFAEHHPDEAVRTERLHLAELLTPVAKSWCTDVGTEVCSTAIQVFGGMGYITETGVHQHWRDVRITPIYEGTNGIQALDLVGRKLPLDGGKPVWALIGAMKDLDGDLAAAGAGFATIRARLAEGVDALERATMWIFEHGLADPVDVVSGASPYLRLFGTVVGGYFLARLALAARGVLDAGNVNGNEGFLEAKIVTARFYAEQLLPGAAALVPAVTAGKADLFAIDPAHFAC